MNIISLMRNDTIHKKQNIIMLVDDSVIDIFLAEKIIRELGMANYFYVHSNAINALEFLKSISKMGTYINLLLPKYIFLDLNMPFLDGFNFLDEFEKRNPSLITKIKIIVVTASLNPDEKQRALDYKSVVGFYNKPLTKDTLESIF